MDIDAIERFCNRWIQKAEACQGDDLENLFDRFFTLFVAYNHLYSAAAELYRATFDLKHRVMLQGDRREATTVMARLIGQPRFSNVVRDVPAVAASVRSIAVLLQHHQFFLHSVRFAKGPDLARDMRLADGLSKHSLLAVLECLYQIRCNIFHGEKEFAPRQAELLIPANILLESILPLSKIALRRIAR